MSITAVGLQRFPDARAIATPKSVELMRKQSPQLPFFRKWWPGQLPSAITLPEPYDGDAFSLEGHEVRIIEQGRTDAVDSTSGGLGINERVVLPDPNYGPTLTLEPFRDLSIPNYGTFDLGYPPFCPAGKEFSQVFPTMLPMSNNVLNASGRTTPRAVNDMKS